MENRRKTNFDKTFRASALVSVLIVLVIIFAVSAPAYFLSSKFCGDYDSQKNEENVEDNDSEDSDSGSIFNEEAESGQYEGFDYSQFDDVEEGQFVYVVNRSIFMEDGESSANIMLINPEQNDFFISIDIEIDGEKIYSSGILKRNSYLEEDTFDKKLEAGEYKAVGKITAYNTTQAEVVETYETELTITVSK